MDIDLLRRISEAPGVSGFEHGVPKIIEKELEGHGVEIERDRFGNLYATKGSGGQTLMVAAHTDEIGLIVKYIDDKGFIRFAKLGGVPDHILLAQRVFVHGKKKTLRGVIGCKAIHVMKEDERKQLVAYDKMFIDTGADKAILEKNGVGIGTPITLDRGLTELEGDLMVGKAMDDRAGCYMLLEALKRAKPSCRVVAVFTVQEEVGLRGATVGASRVKPTVGIAIDTTIAGDHPEIGESEAPVKVGGGVTVLVVDGRRDSLGGGLIANPKVREWMVETAEKSKIPYQLEILEGGTTDAAAMQVVMEGVPSGVLSIPSRYVHSFSEVVSKKDLDNGIKLLVKLMESKLPA
jgi:putative aminopeptidase FrvX